MTAVSKGKKKKTKEMTVDSHIFIFCQINDKIKSNRMEITTHKVIGNLEIKSSLMILENTVA